MEEKINDLTSQLKEHGEQIQKLLKNFESFCKDTMFPEWISRKSLMEFLDYGDTQMAALLKEPDIVVAEIGARKFIEKKSFLNFLERNIKSKASV